MKRILIISLILTFSLMTGGCIKQKSEKKGYTETKHQSAEEKVELKNKSGQKIGEGNVKIEADIEYKTDCDDKECFEKKFKQCSPATVTLTMMKGLSYYYEIIGKKNGLCEVKSQFTANPNPEWVGKEMVCKYDNSKNFDSAIKDMNNCDGPLYKLMTGK